MVQSSVKITLIVLLYNAQETVEALVDAALAQCHPFFPRQSDWLDIVFMDDSSRDATLTLLDRALERAGHPSHIRTVANERNIGLSGVLNKAFGLTRTPYGLTCHLDVLFGRSDYVAQMLALMEAHPEAGAITGQPQISPKAKISTAEKFNIIANLMDIFPGERTDTLIPVGFAEGRCDVFRLEALRKAGFWDTTLRVSGEDQILAARMREQGYEIYQAPWLFYYLSVSGEQNSICKLLKHAHLFGRTQPYILLSSKKSLAGVTGETSGANRQARLLLRASHLLGSFAWFVAVIGLCMGLPAYGWALPLLGVVVFKGMLFRRHVAEVSMGLREILFFLVFFPLQDICYTAGLVQGIWSYFRSAKGCAIR